MNALDKVKPMDVLLLSRYGRMGASSRLRSYQYLPFLESRGMHVTVAPLLDDSYLSGLYSDRVSWPSVLKSYARRLRWLWSARNFDLVWIEKEALPWLPASVELRMLSGKTPIVVDYDDAQFHRYDQHTWAPVRQLLGHKIDRIMASASVVVVGNDYLAERARSAGARRVEYLPTVVDLARYESAAPPSRQLSIGWIGTPATARYLDLIAGPLMRAAKDLSARITLVGAGSYQAGALPVTVLPWQEESEVTAINDMDIGIMPLVDNPWERGKCGYKLIQYMACGKAVVASPVGMNRNLVSTGVNGFLASTDEEWWIALKTLGRDQKLRRRMGEAGRRRIEEGYSLQVHAPRLEALLRLAVR